MANRIFNKKDLGITNDSTPLIKKSELPINGWNIKKDSEGNDVDCSFPIEGENKPYKSNQYVLDSDVEFKEDMKEVEYYYYTNFTIVTNPSLQISSKAQTVSIELHATKVTEIRLEGAVSGKDYGVKSVTREEVVLHTESHNISANTSDTSITHKFSVEKNYTEKKYPSTEITNKTYSTIVTFIQDRSSFELNESLSHIDENSIVYTLYPTSLSLPCREGSTKISITKEYDYIEVYCLDNSDCSGSNRKETVRHKKETLTSSTIGSYDLVALTKANKISTRAVSGLRLDYPTLYIDKNTTDKDVVKNIKVSIDGKTTSNSLSITQSANAVGREYYDFNKVENVTIHNNTIPSLIENSCYNQEKSCFSNKVCTIPYDINSIQGTITLPYVKQSSCADEVTEMKTLDTSNEADRKILLSNGVKLSDFIFLKKSDTTNADLYSNKIVINENNLEEEREVSFTIRVSDGVEEKVLYTYPTYKQCGVEYQEVYKQVFEFVKNSNVNSSTLYSSNISRDGKVIDFINVKSYIEVYKNNKLIETRECGVNTNNQEGCTITKNGNDNVYNIKLDIKPNDIYEKKIIEYILTPQETKEEYNNPYDELTIRLTQEAKEIVETKTYEFEFENNNSDTIDIELNGASGSKNSVNVLSKCIVNSQDVETEKPIKVQVVAIEYENGSAINWCSSIASSTNNITFLSNVTIEATKANSTTNPRKCKITLRQAEKNSGEEYKLLYVNVTQKADIVLLEKEFVLDDGNENSSNNPFVIPSGPATDGTTIRSEDIRLRSRQVTNKGYTPIDYIVKEIPSWIKFYKLKKDENGIFTFYLQTDINEDETNTRSGVIVLEQSDVERKTINFYVQQEKDFITDIIYYIEADPSEATVTSETISYKTNVRAWKVEKWVNKEIISPIEFEWVNQDATAARMKDICEMDEETDEIFPKEIELCFGTNEETDEDRILKFDITLTEKMSENDEYQFSTVTIIQEAHKFVFVKGDFMRGGLHIRGTKNTQLPYEVGLQVDKNVILGSSQNYTSGGNDNGDDNIKIIGKITEIRIDCGEY